jgi:hypothetical protein
LFIVDLEIIQDPGYDLPGFFMVLLSGTFVIYAPLVNFFALYLNLDPYYFMIKMIPWINESSWLVKIIRTVLLWTAGTETCRIFPLIFMMTLSGLRIDYNILSALIEAISKVNENRSIRLNRARINYVMRMYNVLQTIMRSHKFTELISCFLLALGLFVSVLFNFATFRMYSILPIVFYVYFPSVSLVICIVIHLTMPKAIDIHELSLQLLRRLKTCGHNDIVNLKYLRRKVRSLRPTAHHVGFNIVTFFYFKKSTRITFYAAILGYTIDLLFTVPQDVLSKSIVF